MEILFGRLQPLRDIDLGKGGEKREFIMKATRHFYRMAGRFGGWTPVSALFMF